MKKVYERRNRSIDVVINRSIDRCCDERDGGRYLPLACWQRLLAVDARRVSTVIVPAGDRFGGLAADSTGSSSVLLESR
jgi:hypothetical protein